MAEPAGIFVSHAHEDNAWCRTFVEALKKSGATVWYDEDNLDYGVLQEELERELRVRPIFIVILSPASVGKAWVRREMAAAMHLRDQNPQRIILPVVLEKAEVPLFWEEYKRVSGPGDTGISATEAAGRVIRMLGIVPAGAPAAAPPPVTTETPAEANTRGNGLYAQKRYEEALAAYEQALTLDRQSAAAWSNKGSVLRNLKRYDEALTAYDQALALDPKNPLTWNGKGAALGHLHRYDEALTALEQALALDPKNSWGWNQKVAMLQRLGRTSEAKQAERQRDVALGSH